MNKDRWVEFYIAHGKTVRDADPQTQVLRTINKQPVSAECWQATLDDVDTKFPVGADDDVLDLACGNGLLTAHLAPRCRSVTSVDISPDLLAALERQKLPNVKTACGDMRTVAFRDGSFSRVLLYACLQHLSEAETIPLVLNAFRWLRPGGLLLIGDVLDFNRLWSFYNTPARQAVYFEACAKEQDPLGTWFDGPWLVRLATHAGFTGAQWLQQGTPQMGAHYRGDLVARRP
jgi:SAM-dependent methyltransferase